VQGDGLALTRCERVAQAIPDISPLAGLRRSQSHVLQAFIDGAQARAVIPQNPVVLRQRGKELPGVAILGFVGAIQTNDDLTQVRYLF